MSWARLSTVLLLSAAAISGAFALAWFADQDGDGFRHVWTETADCNDADASIFPGAPETPLDGIDDDCDGRDSVRGSNVVLVTFDALRADNLGSYGYERVTSPHVDRLADEGVLFRNAYASSSWTIPSLGSLHTSLYPRQHGASKVKSGLGEKVPLLAEILKDAGYATAMFFTSAYPLDEMGFGRGFGTSLKHPASHPKRVHRWLKEHSSTPFFVWIHYYKPHVPYNPGPEYDGLLIQEKAKEHKELTLFWNRKECQRRRQLASEKDEYIRMGFYDETIRESDDALGGLLEEIESLGLTEKTLVVFSSDHGEEFFEHGGCDHGRTLYDEVIHVPLVIRHPGLFAPGVVEEAQVRTIDIAPTILEALEIEAQHPMMGTSLIPRIAERITERPVFAGFLQHGRPSVAVRMGGFKLIKNAGPRGGLELYDLSGDPDELQNLAGSNHPKLPELQAALDLWLQETDELYSGVEVEHDEETIERLRSLGYLE